MKLKKIVYIIMLISLLICLTPIMAATIDNVETITLDTVGKTYTITADQIEITNQPDYHCGEITSVSITDSSVANYKLYDTDKDGENDKCIITSLKEGVTEITINGEYYGKIGNQGTTSWQNSYYYGSKKVTLQVGKIDSVSQLPITFTVSDSFKKSAWNTAKNDAAEKLAAIGLTPATTGLETSWRNYDEKEYKGEKQQAHEKTVVIYCKDTSGNTRKVQLFFTYYDNANEGEAKLTDLGTISGEERYENVFTNDVLEDISQYAPGDLDSTSSGKIESMTSRILTVISNIGIAISVIMLAVLGVKYMLGSVEEKAEYKEGLVPYVVGAFILFGITAFIKILIGIGNSLNGI